MGNENLQTFCEILYPGSFLPETDEVIVKLRDPEKIADKYKRCFQFQFYDQMVKEVKVDGQVSIVRGPKRNESPKYFPGGVIMGVSDIKTLPGDYKILISNMESNGWKKVVRCRTGNFQPFEKNCEIIGGGASRSGR